MSRGSIIAGSLQTLASAEGELEGCRCRCRCRVLTQRRVRVVAITTDARLRSVSAWTMSLSWLTFGGVPRSRVRPGG